MDTAQAIWTAWLANGKKISIDSHKNSYTDKELYLVRERQTERIFSDNSSINRFAVSQAILSCLNLIYDNWTDESQLYSINTDGVFTPYNPLDQQLEYNKDTSEITEWHVKPYNKVDEIAAYHDVCFDMGKNKGDCDKVILKSLDEIPYGEMPKWDQTARFLINTKQKLGLGLKWKSRRV